MAKSDVKKMYNSKQWKQTREYILKRDSYICKHCGDVANEVHHVTYVNSSNINDSTVTLNEKNLISLCRDCHCRIHDNDRVVRKPATEKVMFDERGQLVKDIPPIP